MKISYEIYGVLNAMEVLKRCGHALLVKNCAKEKRGLIHLWKTRLPWWSHWWRPVCALLCCPCPLGGLRVGAEVGGAKLKRLVEAVLLATPLS